MQIPMGVSGGSLLIFNSFTCVAGFGQELPFKNGRLRPKLCENVLNSNSI